VSIRVGFERGQVTNCGQWGCVSCSTKTQWATPRYSATMIPSSFRDRDTDFFPGLYPFLVTSACPQWITLWCSHCCSLAGEILSPWPRRQQSPNSVPFPLICLFPKGHIEGPRHTADINLMVTLWWSGFAAIAWTLPA